MNICRGRQWDVETSLARQRPCVALGFIVVLSCCILPPSVELVSEGQFHDRGSGDVAGPYHACLTRILPSTRLCSLCATDTVAQVIMQESEGNPGDAEEFKLFKNGYRCLDHYRQFLCTLYTAEPDSYELSFKRWKVSKIRTYKDRGTLVKHEYLVATLCDADGHELELRMERRVQESSAIGLITKSLSALGSASPAAAADGTTPTSTQTKDDKFRKWAADEISVCSSSSFDDDQVQVDHFRFQDGHHVPLPQLVVLACAINEYCATYHITLSNCYWFCDVASKALKRRFDHMPEPVGDSGELGRWHGISICSSSDIEAVVTEVLENYEKSWYEFCSKVF